MPLNHVGGMTCTVTAAMVAGGSVALLAPATSPARHCRQHRSTRRVTLFVGVPTMYAMMLGLPEFAEADTSSVRICVIGGSNVEPDSAGASSMSSPAPVWPTSTACPRHRAAASSPHPTTTSTPSSRRSVSPSGPSRPASSTTKRALPPGAEGELQISGECVAAGYWERPEEHASTFLPDGGSPPATWRCSARTAGWRCAAGRRRCTSAGGYNVYPAEIENVLAGEPSVAMSAVIGVPHPIFGEVGTPTSSRQPDPPSTRTRSSRGVGAARRVQGARRDHRRRLPATHPVRKDQEGRATGRDGLAVARSSGPPPAPQSSIVLPRQSPGGIRVHGQEQRNCTERLPVHQ